MKVRNPTIEGVLALLITLAGCCADIPPYQVPSPDGKLIASVEVKNCSGLDPYLLYVNVRPSGGLLGFFGFGATVFGQEGPDSAEIEWVGPRELLIRAKRARVLQRLDRWKDVTIRVEEQGGS